jgi:hypothetical protein
MLVGIVAARLAREKRFRLFVAGVLTLWLGISLWVTVLLAYPPDRVRWVDAVYVFAALAVPALMMFLDCHVHGVCH